jgi:hypothetical protein
MIHNYTFKIDGGDPVTVQASGLIEAVGMLDPGLDWYMTTRTPVVDNEVDALKARVMRLEKVIRDATNNGLLLDCGEWVYPIGDDDGMDETPAQSLLLHDAEVLEKMANDKELLCKFWADGTMLNVTFEDCSAMQYLAEFCNYMGFKKRQQAQEKADE